MKYTEDYALTHDIDLFARDKQNNAIHIASNGTLLSVLFDGNENDAYSKAIFSNSDSNMYEVKTNNEVVDAILKFSHLLFDYQTAFNNYVSTFVEMASFGFVSHDVICVDSDGNYICAEIARPSKNKPSDNNTMGAKLPDKIKFVSSPDEIRAILSNTKE